MAPTLPNIASDTAPQVSSDFRHCFQPARFARAAIHRLIDVFGASQIMAGTDYPFTVVDEDPAGRISGLALAPALAHQLRAGNAERWLGCTPQGTS